MKDIGNRDFSKIDLSIFNKTNKDQNKYYSDVFQIVTEEYEVFLRTNIQDINEYFLANQKTQRPLLFVLMGSADNKKLLLEILKEYEKVLIPTFNDPKQFSILHCLAKQSEVFDDVDKEIFELVANRTTAVTRNRFNRTFLGKI